MTIKEVLNYGVEKLKESSSENEINKAKMLLTYVLKVQREYLIINSEEIVDENKIIQYKQNINDLIIGKPLQYITNQVEFMKLKFYVDENVLIPRPDTEILVEEIVGAAYHAARVAYHATPTNF